MQDDFAVVPGEDQVNAGSLEVAVEQQMRVGNNDSVLGHARMWQRMDGRSQRAAPAFGCHRVEFARIIQGATRKG